MAEIIEIERLGLSEGLVRKLEESNIHSHLDIHHFDVDSANLSTDELTELAKLYLNGFKRTEEPVTATPKKKALVKRK